jgi:hypothetical protein
MVLLSVQKEKGSQEGLSESTDQAAAPAAVGVDSSPSKEKELPPHAVESAAEVKVSPSKDKELPQFYKLETGEKDYKDDKVNASQGG